MFLVQVLGRKSFKPFCQETELQVDMIILNARWSWKSHFSAPLGKTQLICLGLQGGRTDWVNMIGYLEDGLVKGIQRSLCTSIQVSWETYLIESVELYSKMVFKRSFIDDMAKPLHICSGVPGDRAQWVDMTVFLRRWSCKGPTGKPLHICSGLSEDRGHQVDMIGLLRRWSCAISTSGGCSGPERTGSG